MLGDKVEQALGCIGINPDRVEKWLGKPCGCVERKEKLNQLNAWMIRVLRGAVDDAEVYLDNLIEEQEDEDSGEVQETR